MPNPLIVAITGASGAIYELRALELLRAAQVETRLIFTATARDIVEHEAGTYFRQRGQPPGEG